MADNDIKTMQAQIAHLQTQVSLMISMQISMYGAISKLRWVSTFDKDQEFQNKFETDVEEISDNLNTLIENMRSRPK